jgi:hypothetical protein
MSQKTQNSKNRLGLNLFEANLKRHPSVKGLFDENGNMKIPTNSNNEYLVFNVSNKDGTNDTIHYIGVDKNEEENSDEENNNKKEVMPVQINRVEEKVVNNKDTFFVEMNDEDKKEIIRIKEEKTKQMSKKTSKPLSYEFNDTQKEFDKDVTDAMSKGKEYEVIEEKFINQLKK